jgi:hypothetical protein
VQADIYLSGRGEMPPPRSNRIVDCPFLLCFNGTYSLQKQTLSELLIVLLLLSQASDCLASLALYRSVNIDCECKILKQHQLLWKESNTCIICYTKQTMAIVTTVYVVTNNSKAVQYCRSSSKWLPQH